MKITRERSEGLYTIHAVGKESVTINAPEASHERDEEGRITLVQSFILSPGSLLAPWSPGSLEALESEHLQPLASLRPEVVLLGTGKTLRFPSSSLLATLVELGVGYEVMDTPAACRTYNILATEGRQVAAAIIIE